MHNVHLVVRRSNQLCSPCIVTRATPSSLPAWRSRLRAGGILDGATDIGATDIALTRDWRPDIGKGTRAGREFIPPAGPAGSTAGAAGRADPRGRAPAAPPPGRPLIIRTGHPRRRGAYPATPAD